MAIIAQLSIIIKIINKTRYLLRLNNKTIPNKLEKMRLFIERNHRRRNFWRQNFRRRNFW